MKILALLFRRVTLVLKLVIHLQLLMENYVSIMPDQIVMYKMADRIITNNTMLLCIYILLSKESQSWLKT